MNQFLVLRIANPYSWVITGADGGRLGPVATGNLEDAAAIAKERQVVAIAPGSSVTLARPELPVRSGAQLAQVLRTAASGVARFVADRTGGGPGESPREGGG